MVKHAGLVLLDHPGEAIINLGAYLGLDGLLEFLLN